MCCRAEREAGRCISRKPYIWPSLPPERKPCITKPLPVKASSTTKTPTPLFTFTSADRTLLRCSSASLATARSHEGKIFPTAFYSPNLPTAPPVLHPQRSNRTIRCFYRLLRHLAVACCRVCKGVYIQLRWLCCILAEMTQSHTFPLIGGVRTLSRHRPSEYEVDMIPPEQCLFDRSAGAWYP